MALNNTVLPLYKANKDRRKGAGAVVVIALCAVSVFGTRRLLAGASRCVVGLRSVVFLSARFSSGSFFLLLGLRALIASPLLLWC